MNWNSLIGRRRPLEIDALRLSTLIHQLGKAIDDTPGIVRRIDGEIRLQTLDHLVRHPTTLAYVLLDQVIRRDDLADRRGTLARRIRQLLANERQQHLPARRRRPWQSKPDGLINLTQHPFVPPRWQRLDDVLAYLSTRGLVRVSAQRPNSEKPAFLSYDLTSTAAEILERDLYPKDRNAMLHIQLCGVINDLLPPFSGKRWQALMGDIETNLQTFHREEQLAPEEDVLSALFFNTFQERL